MLILLQKLKQENRIFLQINMHRDLQVILKSFIFGQNLFLVISDQRIITKQQSLFMNIITNIRKFFEPVKNKARSIQMKRLTTKASMAVFATFSYLTVMIYYFFTKPEKLTIKMSKTAQSLSEVKIPKLLRKNFFKTYSKYYKVNLNQIIEPLDQFQTFSSFFTRKIISRDIDMNQNKIVSPADSKILQISEIIEDKCSIIKGACYSLGQLFGNSQKYTIQQINSLKREQQNKLYQVIFYLAPGDYHRFHSPTNYKVHHKSYIEGVLFGVSEKTLLKRKKVYEKNARLCVHGKWNQGYMGLVMVGALNVGKIIINQHDKFDKGEELGYFNLGSTIVMIFEAKGVKQWSKLEQDKVKYGQSICEVQI